MSRKPATPRTIPQLLTVEAAAARLSVSEDYVRRLIDSGAVEFVKLGDLGSPRAPVRIPEPALAAFVAAHTYPPKATPHA